MQIFLETERLLLRQFTLDDIDNLLALDSDIEVRRYLDMPASPTRRQHCGAHAAPVHGLLCAVCGLRSTAAPLTGAFSPGHAYPHPASRGDYRHQTGLPGHSAVEYPGREVRQQMGHIREWGGQFVTLIPDVVGLSEIPPNRPPRYLCH